MKAATGELNLTVITLIALAAVIGFFWAFWPTIKNSIQDQWKDVNGEGSQGKTNGQNWNESMIIINDYVVSYNK